MSTFHLVLATLFVCAVLLSAFAPLWRKQPITIRFTDEELQSLFESKARYSAYGFGLKLEKLTGTTPLQSELSKRLENLVALGLIKKESVKREGQTSLNPDEIILYDVLYFVEG